MFRSIRFVCSSGNAEHQGSQFFGSPKLLVVHLCNLTLHSSFSVTIGHAPHTKITLLVLREAQGTFMQLLPPRVFEVATSCP
jgi:hypothetical protein